MQGVMTLGKARKITGRSGARFFHRYPTKTFFASALLVLLISLVPKDCKGAVPQLSDLLKKSQRLTFVGNSDIKRWFDVTLTDTELGLRVTETWDTGTVVTTFLPYKDIFAVNHPSPFADKRNAQNFSLRVNCIHPIHQEVVGDLGVEMTTWVNHFEILSNQYDITLLGSEAADALYKYLAGRRSGEIRVDCGEDRQKSCLSFAEMLKDRDQEILELVTDVRHRTYVCFRPEDSVRRDDDSFFILDYQAPAEDNWVGHKPRLLANNHLEIHEYADGVSDSLHQFWARMKWFNPSAKTVENGSLAPVQDELVPNADWGIFGIVGKPYVDVSDTEISLQYSYRNVKNETVAYSLQIRKATRRFVETLDVKNPYYHFESSGSCAGYGLAARTEPPLKPTELVPMLAPRRPSNQ